MAKFYESFKIAKFQFQFYGLADCIYLIVNLDIVYTLFVVAKIRASLLHVTIWRDRMMELGILVFG